MKAVVFACLGILLMAGGLGSGHGDLRGSDDELLDNGKHVRSIDKSLRMRLWTFPDGKARNITCSADREAFIISAVYGLEQCQRIVFSVVEQRCSGKSVCSVPINKDVLMANPCPGQLMYLSVKWKCYLRGTSPTYYKSHALQRNEIQLKCPPGEQTTYIEAFYGFASCYKPVTYEVKNQCLGKHTCDFKVTSTILGGDFCPEERKVLDVLYKCGKTLEVSLDSKIDEVKRRVNELITQYAALKLEVRRLRHEVTVLKQKN